MAAQRDQRRRIVDHRQPPRIARLAQRHQAHAGGPRCLDLALGLLGRADARRTARPAAARQAGQRRERGRRAAELAEQGLERPRPRYYGANATSRADPDK
jgi:hypothetical protein